ncbi:hypothetical protein SAMN05216249_11195 [Acetitomaculum ruminis DSM 5522]|uniref:Uncharacterized protein n=1 Tax=Acetitomaculum ruminis DSM 5522 TaxID=1120918 RepID=A0A1I0YVM8_9FIRM|nr:hypothetical protein [Acetitomaculum ruminis]SFB17311.1 hypothetical protein SAMN05216249_11195 [Acetitomaculum ruminis DSM 5522]
MLKKILINKYIKIPLIIVCFISIICFSFFQIRRLIVINYLNNRYGDGDWKIVACKDTYYTSEGCFFTLFRRQKKDGVRYEITSSYTQNKPFCIFIKGFIIENDEFLPTYYSIKYKLKYIIWEDTGFDNDFEELEGKIKFINDYHYPFKDYVSNYDDFYINNCATALYIPEMYGNEDTYDTFKDLFKNNKKVPDLSETIDILEKCYCSYRKRNSNIDDEKFYNFIFSKNVSDVDIDRFIYYSVDESERNNTFLTKNGATQREAD